MRRVTKTGFIYPITLLLILLAFASCSRPKLAFDDYTVIDVTYPEQEEMEQAETVKITKGNDSFVIIPQAKYRVGAVVRSKKAYRSDSMAKISPYDFALVWGFLADEHFYRQLKISQGGRRYFFRPKKNSELSLDWVYLHSSNHHLIPANDNIRLALRSVRKNDRVQLEGYLVIVRAKVKGRTFTWRTSLARDDRGDGSCEIMLVEKIKINYSVYE
jgi:hypothetical protein